MKTRLQTGDAEFTSVDHDRKDGDEMGWRQHDPGIFDFLIASECRRLQLEFGFTDEELVPLVLRSRGIFSLRIHPVITPNGPTINHENCCRWVGIVLEASIRQACLEAARKCGIRLVRPSDA